MKKSTLSLAIGLLLACSTGMAKTQHLTLEQRMALLEERLEAAEMRAAKAESQVKQLQTQQAAEIREIKAAQGNTPVNGQTTAESAKKNATSPFDRANSISYFGSSIPRREDKIEQISKISCCPSNNNAASASDT